METVEALIDKATKVCGSRYKLAQRIQESEGNLSRMANGHRLVTPRIAARLAELVGANPRDAACAALVYAEKDPNKRAELARLFAVTDPYPDMARPEGLLRLIV